MERENIVIIGDIIIDLKILFEENGWTLIHI